VHFHAATVRLRRRLTGKCSGGLTQGVDLLEPAGDLVQTGGHWGRHIRYNLRSIIDWLSELYTAKRNPYLRLSQDDRRKFGLRSATLFVAVILFFAIWHLLSG